MIIFYLGKLLHVDHLSNDDDYFFGQLAFMSNLFISCWPPPYEADWTMSFIDMTNAGGGGVGTALDCLRIDTLTT